MTGENLLQLEKMNNRAFKLAPKTIFTVRDLFSQSEWDILKSKRCAKADMGYLNF